MSQYEFAHFLAGISLSKSADPAIRYKIAVEKSYSRENYKVYKTWLDRVIRVNDTTH